MNILLYTLYYTPDIGPDPPLMSSLVQELVRIGHKVTVISSFPHYKKSSLPKAYKGKYIEKEDINPNYKIIRTWVYVSSTRNIYKRLLNYLSFMAGGLIAGLFVGKIDVVIVYTPPPTNGVIGYLVSRLKHAKLIYNVQDIYPDIGIKLGIFTNKAVICLSQKLENFIYKSASVITVISEGFKKNLISKGVPENKISVIYNWIDTDFIKPIPFEESLRSTMNWNGKFIVLYAGNIGMSQGLENIFNVARSELLPKDVLFVIVGEGEGRANLEEQSQKMGLINIEFHDFFPNEVLPLFLGSANVSLVMLKSNIYSESVPLKMISIMSSSRPILAVVSPMSDTWSLVQESKAGLCIDPNDSSQFVNGILTLYNSSDLCNKLGKNGRDWVVKNGDLHQAAAKYDKLIKSPK
jgi:colanic acid biosynthesis glycosyl transferase WcaI